jgi:PilZ domain-containing protein
VSSEFQERRRFPRVQVDGPYELRVARRVRVRLLDISASGALLATDERFPVGARVRLQMLLGPTPFETSIDVKREEAAPDGRGRVVGVSMASLQAPQRETLDEFLRRAGT